MAISQDLYFGIFIALVILVGIIPLLVGSVMYHYQNEARLFPHVRTFNKQKYQLGMALVLIGALNIIVLMILGFWIEPMVVKGNV